MAVQTSVNRANAIDEVLANKAIGALVRELGWVGQTKRVYPIKADLNSRNLTHIEIIYEDTLSNERAPGADVIDTVNTPVQLPIPTKELEQSFLGDWTWYESSDGMGTGGRLDQELTHRMNLLAQDVNRRLNESITTTVGLQTVGALGVSLVKADIDAARKFLSEASIPLQQRMLNLSIDQNTDISNIPEYADYNVGGRAGQHATGIIPQVAGFDMIENPYAYSPAASQHIGFAAWMPAITTVWYKQNTIVENPMAHKFELVMDGLRIYVLREYVPGKNGAWRWTISCSFGAAPNRDEGVILTLGK